MRGRGWLTAAVLGLVLGLSGCESGDGGTGGAEASADGSRSPSAEASAQEASLRVRAPERRAVPLDHPLSIRASGGALAELSVTGGGEPLEGELEADASAWVPQGRLEPGTTYRVEGRALRGDGSTQPVRTWFRTEELTLDQQTYPSVAPLAGETVGVGMPVIVGFDLPVADRETFERHMEVTSTPAQAGSWHWLSDREAHWRPRRYWQPGTRVRVDVDVNSLPAGNGVFGQESRTVEFAVGDAVVSRVDVARHRMDVLVNGRVARSLPISAGKPGWETRSGTKVIIEKFRSKTMDAATIGVAEDDPEYYALDDVEYALRVTYSGEFLHAAPWSAGSQGSANVSHGCVGMSTADAAWLYDLTKRGDVVEVTGSPRRMTLTNGYGDWNLPFEEYRRGSALS